MESGIESQAPMETKGVLIDPAALSTTLAPDGAGTGYWEESWRRAANDLAAVLRRWSADRAEDTAGCARLLWPPGGGDSRVWLAAIGELDPADRLFVVTTEDAVGLARFVRALAAATDEDALRRPAATTPTLRRLQLETPWRVLRTATATRRDAKLRITELRHGSASAG